MTIGLTVVAVTYGHAPHALEVFVNSIILQTVKEWKLIVLHDGNIRDQDSQTRVSAIRTRRVIEKYVNDFPITYLESDLRQGNWGHALREQGLQMADTKYVCFQNCDNYVTPVFVEKMLGRGNNGDMDFVYCNILHNYPCFGGGYNVLDSAPVISQIDMSNFIVRTDMAKEVGFPFRDFAADGLFIQALMSKYPSIKIAKLHNVYTVHN